MLDTKDRRILAELDFNARKSDAAIGRAVGLSKQNVRYRINRLMEEGIITGFYPLIDNGVRGYYYCRLVLGLHNITNEIVEELTDYVLKNKKFTWALLLEGKYDIGMTMWTKDLREFRTEVQKLLFKFGRYVKHKEQSIGLDITHLPVIRVDGVEPVEIHVRSAAGQIQIDEMDEVILTELSKNARIPTVVIASKTGLSPNAVKYRMAKMAKSGILKAFRPSINPHKLGLLHFKVLLYLKEMTPKDYLKLKTHLKYNGVNYIVEEIGIADLDFEILLPSHEEMFEFMDQLRKTFSNLISDYEIIILKKTLKIGYLPVD